MSMENRDFSPRDLIVNVLPPVEAESAEILSAAFAALPDACYLFDTERADVTLSELRAAYVPIKSFRTRTGIQFEIVEAGVARWKEWAGR